MSGKYSYRLKQIDLDGSFEYSCIVEFEIAVPEKFSLEQNYPNPFNPTTRIKYSVHFIKNGRNILVQLKVYNILGKELKTIDSENLSSGIYKADFNASEYPGGLYFNSINWKLCLN